ncbi:MAG TPA: cation acetate symporter [Rhodospirillaceae bacterium]|nr:cation acetate symporter [Rhodospirillaceae bacterium]
MESSVSPVAISLFFGVVAITLLITYMAAKRSRTTSDLYAAGGRIKPWQNGWAIAGDLLSAATFLGGIGMFFYAGYDALLYAFPAMIGFIIMLGFIAGPMRRLGRFTFADAAATRLSPVPIRIVASLSALAVTFMYLIAQMLGAGGLIQILFGIPYTFAVIIVGGLMVIYVAFGGMLATTWVQFTKAMLLVLGVTVLSFLALGQASFSLDELYARATDVHALGLSLMQPGGLGLTTLESISLSLAIGLGIPGMPHILMRFFTVHNPVAARRSLVVGMAVVGITFFIVYMVLGPAGVAFVANNPDALTDAGTVQGGNNMVALHLARFLGGEVLFGIIAAVAFATILAVVAGLTVAAASALSHDLYASVFARGKASDKHETIAFRGACIFVGIIGIGLGIAFEGQNILFLTGLLYSIAASACFPILVMAMFWRRLTTAGAVAGGYVGLGLSVGLIIIGPSVWEQVLGNAEAIIPLSQPAIVSMPAAFLTMVIVSLFTREDYLGSAHTAQ